MLLWTHKESVSKALGTGLGANFARFKVEFVPESFGEPSLPRRASVILEDGAEGSGGGGGGRGGRSRAGGAATTTTWEVESASLTIRREAGEPEEEHIVAVAFDAESTISRPWIEIRSLDSLLQHAIERSRTF
jgi:hypothetical protein